MENDLKGNENYFELTEGSSYRESTVLICFSEGGNILNELLNNINFGFGSHMKIRNLLVYNA